MSIVDQYKPGLSFWEIAPGFTTVEPTMSLYKSDRSRKKEKSSKLMWAIALINDPDSMFFNLPNKHELLARDHLGDEKFGWDDVEYLAQFYRETKLTQAQRSFIAWEDFMRKRDKTLKNQDYTFDYYKLDEDGATLIIRGKPVLVKGTAEQLDKAATVTAKLYTDYANIKKQMEEDKVKKGKGGKNKSLSESNDI